MVRKLIFSLVLCLAFLLILSNLVAAGELNGPAYQMGMGTPTPVPQALSTPLSGLPLSGTAAQTGTCPMMSGSGMTGAGMSGMGMGDMSGMSMGGMSGMSGMSMSGMSGMDMSGVSGMAMNYPSPWYSNPWWLLGWVLLTLLVIAILAGAVFGAIQLIRRNRPAPPVGT
jgi:hypothetical protein